MTLRPTLLILLIIQLLFLTGCSKESVAPPPSSHTPPTQIPLPTYAEADAVLSYYDRVTSAFPFSYASAHFRDTAGGPMMDIGSVDLNDQPLQFSSSTQIYSLIDMDHQTDPSGQNVWSIQAEADLFPTFTHTIDLSTVPMPVMQAGDTIDVSTSYQITIDPLSGIDSVIFELRQGSLFKDVTISGSQTSAVFTAGMMDGFTSGSVLLVGRTMKIEQLEVDGKVILIGRSRSTQRGAYIHL